MKTKLIRNVTATVISIVLLVSTILSVISSTVLAARMPPSTCNTATLISSGVIPSWVSSRNVTTQMQDVLDRAGVNLSSGSTGVYRVGQTSGFMCVSASLTSPSRDRAPGSVYRCTGSQTYSGDIPQLRNHTYAQIVNACYNSSNWMFAHIVLSKVITGDSAMYDAIKGNSYTSTAISSYLQTLSFGVGSPFYVYVPDSTNYQILIGLSYTPEIESYSVTFTKTDGTAPLAGAVIEFTTTSGADVSELYFANNNSVSDVGAAQNGSGVRFTTTGQSVTIRGLQPGHQYRFTEINPPPTQNGISYTMAQPIDVTVAADGTVTSSQGGSTVTMVDTPNSISGSVTFRKLDQNQAPVQNATIRLVSDGPSLENVTYNVGLATVTTRTNSYIEFVTGSGNSLTQISFDHLLPGNYHFEETVVPTDYTGAANLVFTINEEGKAISNGVEVPGAIFTMIDSRTRDYPYGTIALGKEADEEFWAMHPRVEFYVYYNMDPDDSCIPTIETNKTWIAHGYVLGNGHVWWNEINSLGFRNMYPADWESYGDYQPGFGYINYHYPWTAPAFVNNGGTETLDFLLTGRYTIVEVWKSGSLLQDGVTSSGRNPLPLDASIEPLAAHVERLYVQSMNNSYWTNEGNFTDGNGDVWHRYSTQVVISETSRNHSDFTPGLNDNYENYSNNVNQGAIWVRNQSVGARLDIDKITNDSANVGNLQFQIWTTNQTWYDGVEGTVMGVNHWSTSTTPRCFATGRVAGNATTGADGRDHYNVIWNYSVNYGVDDRVNTGGGSSELWAYGTDDTTSYINSDVVRYIPAGTYELREYGTHGLDLTQYATPDGWTLKTDSTGTYFSRTITISEGQANNRITVSTPLVNDFGSVTVRKVDAITGNVLSNYGGSSVATFALYEDVNGNGQLDSSDRQIAVREDTDRDGIVEFMFSDIYASTALANIPENFLVIETVAPDGYYLADNAIACNRINNPNIQVTCEDMPTTSISVQKVDQWTGAVLSNYEGPYDATFALYEDANGNGRLDAGETLISTMADTDRNGIVEFDFASIYSGRSYASVPKHFVVIETVAPLGYYINSEPIAIDLTTYQRTVSVTCEDTPYTAHITVHKLDGNTAEALAGAVFDVYVDVDNNGIWDPNIDTLAQTFNGTSMINVSFTYDEATKVYVSSELRPGNYILVETGLPVGYYYTDGNGNVCESNNTFAFTVDVADTSAADFEVVNVETTLYNKKPSVRTTLTNESGSHEVGLSDSITLVDVVEYTNLFTDRDYTVTGVLMNKATGQPIVDGNGNQITSTVTFRPTSSNGTVNVTFVVNTNYLFHTVNAPQVVCFETIRQNGVDIVSHTDINDVDQTVYINNPPPPPTPTPGVRTTATDASTGTHTFAQTTTAQVVDIVEYTNLNVGQTYTVTGTLQAVVFDANGNPTHVGPLVQNGQPVTAQVSFVPTATSGTVEVRFNVDVTDLMARHISKVVVFEDLWYNGFKIATHSDINDEGQTVNVCDLHTTATVGGTHSADASSDVTLVDRVYFEGLQSGREYRLETDVMRHSTGESIAHKTTVFTATTSSGYIDIEMHFDASGFSSDEYVVVFEQGYDNQANILIRSHMDWNDQDQTITFTPKTGVTTGTDVMPKVLAGMFVVLDIVLGFQLVSIIDERKKYYGLK